jgi:hypothetical protein
MSELFFRESGIGNKLPDLCKEVGAGTRNEFSQCLQLEACS